jgi:hypothetical protein
LCRHCLVGLCKDHLVASTSERRESIFSCRHDAERPFAAAADQAGLTVATEREGLTGRT